MSRRFLLLVAFALGAATVVGLTMLDWRPGIWQKLRPETPHQRYARALAESGLGHTALATEWLAAAARARQHPVALAVPFTEEALLDPARPVSLGYAVMMKRGQTFTVQVTVKTDTPGRVFIDLIEPDAAGNPDRPPVASAGENETVLSHEARQSGAYVLRIQPELLRGGHLRVTSTPAPSLGFPVSGGDARNIQSVYGDPRDAGRRSHEGIDIFAARGTPVLSASDGVVIDVGENRLGGRVVWVLDSSRGVRLYYAHLEEQLARTGAVVRTGDTLGTVGNTGNARTTAPHLHFGIYARGEGALDPDAFIRPVSGPPERSEVKTSALGELARTRRPVALRASPSDTAPTVERLPRGSVVRVEGTLGSWIRTSTPGQPTAFVEARELDIARVQLTP